MDMHTGCICFHLATVQAGICFLSAAEVGGFSGLFCSLSGGFALGDIECSKSLELGLGTLGLDVFLQLGILCFGMSLCLDPCKLDSHVELSLAVGELGIGLELITSTLGLEDCRLSVDSRYLLLCLSSFLGFSDFSSHASFGDLDLGLVEGTFMGLTAKICEIFASGSILELLDVGVVTIACESATFF